MTRDLRGNCRDCGVPVRRPGGQCRPCYMARRLVEERASLAERFWARVDRSSAPEACWPWTTRVGRFGYGRLSVDRRQVHAHRVAFELSGGSIPDGFYVLHRCDNPPCCNPAHLFVGTHADNMRDRHQKGRYSPAPRSTGGSDSAEVHLGVASTSGDVDRPSSEAPGSASALGPVVALPPAATGHSLGPRSGRSIRPVPGRSGSPTVGRSEGTHPNTVSSVRLVPPAGRALLVQP